MKGQAISVEVKDKVARVGLEEVSFSEEDLKNNEVLIEVHAAPINPSDGLTIFHMQSVDSLEKDDAGFKYKAEIPNQKSCAGHEGAGKVVKAGSECKDLVGKMVAFNALNSAYSTYVKVSKDSVMVYEGDIEGSKIASSFINPQTVLGFVETMKAENFSGIIHTAAASALGQQLVRVCKKDNIPLVNIVRSKEQVETLKALGAEYVVNSSDEDFETKLTESIVKTQAFVAFDAIGGGEMAGTILNCMEQAAVQNPKTVNFGVPYGTTQTKKVYIYGFLGGGEIKLPARFGMTWSVGGWIIFGWLMTAGPDKVASIRKRIAEEIDSSFATHYSHIIGLKELVDLETARKYYKPTAGVKYLVDPRK